jgi:hypothetical protein
MKTRVWRRGLAWLRIGVFTTSFLFASYAGASPNTAHVRITDEASLRDIIARHANIEFAGNAFITFTQPINITSDLTLDARANKLVLSGENVTRLFNVATGANLTLKNLTLANGRSTNAGAIWNDGNLTLINCTFSNNIACGADGANGVDGPLSEGQTHDGTPGEDARGGAILNQGSLRISNSVFFGNGVIAGRGGTGGVGRSATNIALVGNGGTGAPGGNAHGGAIYNSGSLALYGSHFSLNAVIAGTGGSGNMGGEVHFTSLVYQAPSGTSGKGGDASGGALASHGSFAIIDCSFTTNNAIGGRGGDGVAGHHQFSLASGESGKTGAKGGAAKGGGIFLGNTGSIFGAVFVQNLVAGARGGNGGGGGYGVNSGGTGAGGPGGEGGAGGSGFGAAIFSAMELVVTKSEFRHGLARAGDGGAGGGGGSSGPQSGSTGVGGSGGTGGRVEGGAIYFGTGGSLTENLFFENQVIAGSGGSGGGGGQTCYCRYSSGSAGGLGGDGGDSAGGAVSFQSGLAVLAQCSFIRNESHTGAGGAGGPGTSFHISSYFPNTWSSPRGGAGGTGGNSGSSLGGAVSSSSELHLSRSLFASNRVEGNVSGSGGNGGGAHSFAGHGGAPGQANDAAGGAVWIDNYVRALDCVFRNNSARGSDGGSGGSGGTLGSIPALSGQYPGLGQAGASGGAAFGGAISLISNRVEFSRTTFDGNTAIGGEGGDAGINGGIVSSGPVNNGAKGGMGGDARGGSINAIGATLFLRDSSISRSRVEGGTGGIAAPAGLQYRYIGFPSPGPTGGGGIGGGVSLVGSIVEIVGCTFDNNGSHGGTGGTGGARLEFATSGGDGGYGGPGYGGGLAQWGGTLAMTNDTFFSNFTSSGVGGIGGVNNGGARGGSGSEGVGGAVMNMTATALVVNVSFAQNFSIAAAGGRGGASGTNTFAPDGENGIAYGGTCGNVDGQIALMNSLFKHHDGSTNAFGAFVDLGHNISSDASFAFTQSSSFNGYDPLVGPLADNGGPTRTLALLSDSPAIDAGSDEACPPTDQRGVPRPFGEHCDIGAFELNERTLSIPGSTTNRSAPRIELGAAPGQGHLSVRIVGTPNSDYRLESSTDLLHWFAMTSLRADTNGCAEVRNLVSTNEPIKFFRVRR